VTSCSASKDDSIPVPESSRVVEPSYYLNQPLLLKLLNTRERIFQDPHTRVGERTTYAFDLYVRAGRAYKKLLESNYHRLKPKLFSSDFIEWLFLSGGYGSLEEFKAAWIKLYGSWKPEQTVTVYEFKLVEGI